MHGNMAAGVTDDLSFDKELERNAKGSNNRNFIAIVKGKTLLHPATIDGTGKTGWGVGWTQALIE
jgi:hypothetical protein